MASRYDMSHLGRQPFILGLRMLLKAMEERRKRHVREEWLALLPWMTEKTYKPFEQFYQERRRRNKPLSRRSKEEILAEVEAIREAAKRTA